MRASRDTLTASVNAATAAQRRAGVPPAQRARQRERESRSPIGFADAGRRDACPALRLILSADTPSRVAGFTLLQMIAVLAIIAVLVAATVPTIIRRVDQAAWTRETSDLNSIADSLTQSITRNKTIPGTNNWATAIANQMSLQVSAITTNSRRFARAFLVDPAYQIGSSVAGQIYTQTTNGTSKPVSARVMIVSSLARALPVSTG